MFEVDVKNVTEEEEEEGRGGGDQLGFGVLKSPKLLFGMSSPNMKIEENIKVKPI